MGKYGGIGDREYIRAAAARIYREMDVRRYRRENEDRGGDGLSFPSFFRIPPILGPLFPTPLLLFIAEEEEERDPDTFSHQ